MCDSCLPGGVQLAQWILRDVDFSTLTHTSTVSAQNITIESTKLFHNGSIITMAGGTYSTVDALVVNNDKIEYAGTIDEAKSVAGSDAQTIDLAGRCLLPGFIEPHVHLALTAITNNRYLYDFLPSKIKTITDAETVLSEALTDRHRRTQDWVAGYGYDPSRVEGHQDLMKVWLDSICKKYHHDTIPVFIINQSGHLAYANTKALEIAKVTAEEINDPKSGFVKKPDAKGDTIDDLNGILLEAAVQRVGKSVPQPPSDQFFQDSVNTLKDWMKKGCTTVLDAGLGNLAGKGDFDLLMALDDPNLVQPHLPLRFYGAVASTAEDLPFNSFPEAPFKHGYANIRAMKFWGDGSTQGFTAALTQDYLNIPEWSKSKNGNLEFDSALSLQAAMDPWLKKGYRLIVHANGDRAIQQALYAYKGLFEANPKRDKSLIHRIDHFTVTNQAQIMTAHNLGLAVSHTIGHVNFWGETFKMYVLGNERAQCIDPLKSDENTGILWSMNSDSSVTNVDPLLYLRTATTRLMNKTDQVLGADQCVDLEAALRGITVNPAKQIGVFDQVGSLEKGKLADMVILDQDPRIVDLKNIHKIGINVVYFGGKPYETTM